MATMILLHIYIGFASGPYKSNLGMAVGSLGRNKQPKCCLSVLQLSACKRINKQTINNNNQRGQKWKNIRFSRRTGKSVVINVTNEKLKKDVTKFTIFGKKKIVIEKMYPLARRAGKDALHLNLQEEALSVISDTCVPSSDQMG